MIVSKSKFGTVRKPITHSPEKKAKKKKGKAEESPVDPNWPRKDLFDEQWKLIEGKLLDLTSVRFEQYVDKLTDFIIPNIDPNAATSTHQMLIPTAIIALNSKHTQQRVFQELYDKLYEKGCDVQTISLESHQAVNVKTLFQAIFKSLLRSEFDRTHEDLKEYSFDDVMSTWLDNHTPNQRPALAFFFQELENFDKEVLQTLVSVLKEYTDRVSIVFTFMIFNHGNCSQYTLPAQITDFLLIQDITPFYEPKLLPEIIKDLIMDSAIPFKIHPQLTKEIGLLFSNFEFSFSHFLFFIKSLVYDHFYNNPLSTVYSTKALREDPKLEDIYRNSLNLSMEKVTFSSDYLQNVHFTYSSLVRKHTEFCVSLEILEAFRKVCLHEEQYKYVTIYSDILNGQFDVRAYLSPLVKVKEFVMITAVTKICDDFEDFKNLPVMKQLNRFKLDLDNYLAKESEENKKQEASVRKLKLDMDGVVEQKDSKLRGLNARLELRKSLLTSIQDSQKLAPNERLKHQFVQELIGSFENHVLTNQKELIDTFFYHNGDFIKKYHTLSVRERFDVCLNKKYSSTTIPDNILLYRLYKEASKNIDLIDMFKEFCVELRMSPKDDKAIVHFSNAFADFEFVGLVQQSKKADVFNKVVWL